MKGKSAGAALVLLLLSVNIAGAQLPSSADIARWREFVVLLKAGPFPSERVRPYQESLRASNLQVLALLRQRARPAEWETPKEVFHVGKQVHYLLPLTIDGNRDTYTFTFVVEDGRWYFQHLDAIQLRLDRIGALPVSSFPDLPESTKAWMRAEQDATRDVWMYNTLVAEKGKDRALKWLLDGAGYALAARVWIPFMSPSRAFVLYACWEQANLRGNAVTLEALSEDAAVVRLASAWFKLYEISGHLKQQITLEDYRTIFEERWRDRAEEAGWRVTFEYAGSEVVMRFTAMPAQANTGT